MVHVLLDTHIIKKSLVFVVEFLMYLQLAREKRLQWHFKILFNLCFDWARGNVYCMVITQKN